MFQVCSNSAHPQHSGERYRTSGPLVLLIKTKTDSELTLFAHVYLSQNLGFLQYECTVNFLNIRTPKKFVVITLKFELLALL